MASAFLAFLSVILLLTGLSWLLVAAFVYDLVPGGWITLVVLWTASVAPLFVLARNLLRGGYASANVRRFVFRFFWYTQLMMIVLAFASAVGFVAGLPFGASVRGGRIVILGLAPLLVLMGLWGYVGSKRLVVRKLDVHLRDLPPPLEGLCIVQLSDLHVGPHTSKKHLARIAEATQRARPHIIALTGDQVDDYPRNMEVFAERLGHLRAPLGVFAIAGNHDVYAGWSAVRKGLERMGVTVLVNRAVALRHQGTEFWLGGTGDPAASQFTRGDESPAPDIARTLSAIPNGAFSIALAHNPALWPALAARKVPLTLSGHTHHGQFSVPSHNWSLASLFLEHAMGAHEREGSVLYISPGANYWGIPFRIGALPEVTVLTLRPSRDGNSIV